jgi:hypothetical protein
VVERLISSSLGIVAVATTGVVLAGCSSGSAVKSAVDPVAQAAEVSELAPGYKASISEEVRLEGMSEVVTATGSGVFDQRDRRGALTFHGRARGRSFGTDAQYADLTMYLRTPHPSPATSGKPWIKVDLRGVGSALGINFAALSGQGSPSDPRQLLSYLKGTSGQVNRIGIEQVQGEPTTHYRGTIDFDRYADRVPAAQRAAALQSVTAIERLTGSHTQLVDVWVDREDRVRREELTYRQCLPNVPGKTQIHLAIELFAFGVQPVPSLPPSDEVADLTAKVAEELKHVKFGCS